MGYPLSVFCSVTTRSKASATLFIACNVASSVTTPSAFILERINEMRSAASSATFEDSAVSVSRSEAWALSPPVAAVIRATGLYTSSPVATVHSSAFFNTPGTPNAYSGLHSSMPSAHFSISLKLVTSGISSLLSLKNGSLSIRS